MGTKEHLWQTKQYEYMEASELLMQIYMGFLDP